MASNTTESNATESECWLENHFRRIGCILFTTVFFGSLVAAIVIGCLCGLKCRQRRKVYSQKHLHATMTDREPTEDMNDVAVSPANSDRGVNTESPEDIETFKKPSEKLGYMTEAPEDTETVKKPIKNMGVNTEASEDNETVKKAYEELVCLSAKSDSGINTVTPEDNETVKKPSEELARLSAMSDSGVNTVAPEDNETVKKQSEELACISEMSDSKTELDTKVSEFPATVIQHIEEKEVVCSSAKSNSAKHVYIETKDEFDDNHYANIKKFLETKDIPCIRLIDHNIAEIKSQPIIYARYNTGRIDNAVKGCTLNRDDIHRTIVLLLAEGQDKYEYHGHEIDPKTISYIDKPEMAFKRNLYGIVLVNVNCLVAPCKTCTETLDKLSTTISARQPLVSDV